ncbi:MAG: response regulator [bacterium]
MTTPGVVPTSPTRRRSPCMVLVAEDHDDTRVAQRLVLEHFGFAVTEARTGLDALAIALVTQPSIVLVDLVLPEIDGCELARMLRADPTTRNASLVALSAMGDQETRERALRAGCDEFVAKPVPPLALARLVQRYARGRAPRTYDFDPLEREAHRHV